MMPPNSDSSFLSFLPILITCAFTGVLSWYLANDKGRNAVGWTIFGCMPVFGIFAMSVLVGVSCLKTQRKLDELLKRQ